MVRLMGQSWLLNRERASASTEDGSRRCYKRHPWPLLRTARWRAPSTAGRRFSTALAHGATPSKGACEI